MNFEGFLDMVNLINQEASNVSTTRIKELFFQSTKNNFPALDDHGTLLYPKLVALQFFTSAKAEEIQVDVPLVSLVPLKTYKIKRLVFTTTDKSISDEPIIIEFMKGD